MKKYKVVFDLERCHWMIKKRFLFFFYKKVYISIDAWTEGVRGWKRRSDAQRVCNFLNEEG